VSLCVFRAPLQLHKSHRFFCEKTGSAISVRREKKIRKKSRDQDTFLMAEFQAQLDPDRKEVAKRSWARPSIELSCASNYGRSQCLEPSRKEQSEDCETILIQLKNVHESTLIYNHHFM
jgi:hypothetical protein